MSDSRWPFEDAKNVAVFTVPAVMQGEADINNDYTVTIGELMDYVEDNVKRQTKGNQHPTRNQGNYDKDMTISLVPH